jgi:8-amino-7-oxononanoate synthase
MSGEEKIVQGKIIMPIESRIEGELETLRAMQRFRSIPNTGTRKGTHITIDGRKLLNLSSNDYLGLGSDRELFRSWMARVQQERDEEGRYAMTSSSSRLLTGHHPVCDDLEATIAQAYGCEASLVFNSGYHANTGLLPALSTRHDLILSDRLSHASIIDGIRIADAENRRFRHADYDHLEELLAAAGRYRQIFIVTESVFSMDGDLADLRRLVEIKQRYRAMLIVDEAHGVGVFGRRGLGLSEQEDVVQEIDIIIGTFGKALASTGAYAVMRGLFREYLVNRMRTLIFTTALPPIVLGWSLETFTRQLGMSKEREHLMVMASILRDNLREAGFDVPGNSHIVPVILGEDRHAVSMAGKLRKAGFHALPVRPPTVPENSSRLRFSLRADLTMKNMEELAATIRQERA